LHFILGKNNLRKIYKDKSLVYDEEIDQTIKVNENSIEKIIYKDILDNLKKYNLTEKEIKVFNLYYKDDLSIKEISNIMNTTDSNIKYYLFNGRKKVKENYND